MGLMAQRRLALAFWHGEGRCSQVLSSRRCMGSPGRTPLNRRDQGGNRGTHGCDETGRAGGQRKQEKRSQAISKTSLPPRACLRNHGARLRQAPSHSVSVQIQSEELLVPFQHFRTGLGLWRFKRSTRFFSLASKAAMGASRPALETADGLPSTVRANLAVDLLRSCGELRMSALGASMVPAIFPGDVLTIGRQDAAAIRSGDIVLRTHEDRFFVHRVVGRSESSSGVLLLTRGDALMQPDPPLGENELLGKVVCIERGGTKLPAVSHLTWREKCLRWGIRRSNLLLRLVLHFHALRRHRWRAAELGAPEIGIPGRS